MIGSLKEMEIVEPESGKHHDLKIMPVKNFAYPSWVVFISDHRNVFLFYHNHQWYFIPKVISNSFAETIGQKLKEINAIE